MFKQALSGYEKISALENQDALNIMYYLGLLYREQKKFNEAEKMYEQALAGYEKIGALEDPNALDTLSSLAIVPGNSVSRLEEVK